MMSNGAIVELTELETIRAAKPEDGYAVVVNTRLWAQVEGLPAGTLGEEQLIYDSLLPEEAGFLWWNERETDKAEEYWQDMMG